MRIAMALLLTTLVATFVYVTGAGALATMSVAGLGLAIIVVMTALDEPPPLHTPSRGDEEQDGDARIIAAITEPVLIVVDGRVRNANAAALTLLGAHIVGEDIRLAIRHPATAEQLAANAPDGTVELIGIGGRDQRYEMNVTTIAHGTRLIHLIDRTGRHAVEQARVDFVANASHELRTPLAAILGFVETLRDENTDDDPVVRARFLEVMDSEARRMQRLIDDLISLSRIEAEKYALPGTKIALPALVKQVAGEIRNGRGESGQRLVLQIDDDIPEVVGEHMQLSQVLHNLIGNAIKYGRDGTPVVVGLKAENSHVKLSIIDQGEGIPPEHIPRLTERFYRVDAGRSRGLGGTGLGLAIVKHIVERHRGRLDISSQIGTGTTVSVTIPAATVSTVTESSPN